MNSKLLGQRIRDARERLGLSQSEFAKRLGRNQNTISEYESGNRKVSAIDLPEFARLLKVSILYFYEGDITSLDIDYDLLVQFHQLPDMLKTDALEMMRLLVSIATKQFPPSS